MQKTQLTETAITQHIEYLIDKKNGLLIIDDYSKGYLRCIEEEIILLADLLPKEKQDIITAYVKGFTYSREQIFKIIKTGDHDPKEQVITEQKYFEQNFTQYKP